MFVGTALLCPLLPSTAHHNKDDICGERALQTRRGHNKAVPTL